MNDAALEFSRSSQATTAFFIWTVYDHPKDDPQVFVARKWAIGLGRICPTFIVMRSTDLEPLRTALRDRGLHRIDRAAGDDPVIVESWV